MRSQLIRLDCFRATDDFAAHVESSSEDSKVVDFRLEGGQLALGPLAEVLVMKAGLRGSGRKLAVVGSGDRGRLFRQVLSGRPPGYASQNGTGVLAVASAGNFVSIEAINGFVLAFGQALKRAGMPDGAIPLVQHVSGELIDNIGEHAGKGMDAFAAFEVFPQHCWLAVADCGRGVLAGYVEDAMPGSAIPEDAAQALDWAVLQHRSRTADPARGLGFRKLQQVLRRIDATVRIRSADASLEVEGQGADGEWLSREQVQLSGFVVSAGLAW